MRKRKRRRGKQTFHGTFTPHPPSRREMRDPASLVSVIEPILPLLLSFFTIFPRRTRAGGRHQKRVFGFLFLFPLPRHCALHSQFRHCERRESEKADKRGRGGGGSFSRPVAFPIRHSTGDGRATGPCFTKGGGSNIPFAER